MKRLFRALLWAFFLVLVTGVSSAAIWRGDRKPQHSPVTDSEVKTFEERDREVFRPKNAPARIWGGAIAICD